MEIGIRKDDNETCRTCLKNVEKGVCLYDVLPGNAIKNIVLEIQYCEMLSSCTGIYAWEGDGFPTRLCEACSNLLTEVWSFISLCKTSNNTLKNCLLKVDEIKLEDMKGDIVVEGDKIELKDDIDLDDIDRDDYIMRAGDDERKMKKKAKKKFKKEKLENVWECEACEVVVNTECRLKKHYKKEHPTILYTYPCKECGKVFKRHNDLRVHARIHSGERPYKCEWCGAGFSQWGTLRQHKYAHTGEKPYSCAIPTCKGRFASIASLRRHERTHSGEKRHVCELCGRKFICVTALRSHLAAHSTNKPYKCSLCSRTFKSRLAQRNHQLTHGERTFVCEDCGKEFFVKGNLSKHRKKMHSEGAGTCTVCHKATSDLKEHASVHSEELNYKCKVCDRRFRHKGILNAHMVLHKNASKYKCPAEGCPKAFYRKNLMEFHFNKLHINKTPHHCDHCPQGFYRISDLTRHINTFHPSQTKPSGS